jgi:hypothetical protein
MMKNVQYHIRGTSPLIMHNGQLADPTNEHSRAISAAVKANKKTKTDATTETMMKAEYMGGLYVDESGVPCIPAEVLESAIGAGARATKEGKQAKVAVSIIDNALLQYKGPKTGEGLWAAGAAFRKVAGVKVGQARLMRIRPMFVDWECTFTVTLNTDIVNERDLTKFIEKAGAEVGIGDWRPKYGRFEVVK